MHSTTEMYILVENNFSYGLVLRMNIKFAIVDFLLLNSGDLSFVFVLSYITQFIPIVYFILIVEQLKKELI